MGVSAAASEPADITLSDGTLLRAAIITELTPTHAVIRHQSGESRVILESVPLDILGRAKLDQDARVEKAGKSNEPTSPPLDTRINILMKVAGGSMLAAILAAAVAYFLFRDRAQRKARESKLKTDLETLTTRYRHVIDADAEVERAKAKLAGLEEAQQQKKTSIATLGAEERSLAAQVAKFRSDLECYDYGLYEPVFDFDISQKFKDEIDAVRELQKQMVKGGEAASCATEWAVNGSVSEGRKQTKHYQKLMLRAFNGEADGIIANVRWNNVDRMIDRLEAAFAAINKLGDTHQSFISRNYWQLKLKELRLVHEHAEKVQAEKEEQRRIGEQIREEERARREIEEALREAENDERKYQQALVRAREDLQRAQGEQVGKMERQIALLEERLREAEQNKQRAISRAQLTRSGHVYIISNIGSFGEGVFKIGMTRRLEPLDRVRELGDASVPFEFDVHAMVYTDDAPTLENLLHTQFGRQRVNLVNDRKEFFNVSIEELQSTLTSHGYKVELIKVPEAKAFRQSTSIRMGDGRASVSRTGSSTDGRARVELFDRA